MKACDVMQIFYFHPLSHLTLKVVDVSSPHSLHLENEYKGS